MPKLIACFAPLLLPNTIAVGTNPGAVAVHPAGTFAYVTNFNSDSVSVLEIATQTVVATLAVGTHPSAVALSASGELGYITNWSSNNLSVLDTTNNTILPDTIAVGTAPTGVAIHGD